MEGFEELQRKLSHIAQVEEQLFQEVDDCGQFVQDDARLRAPVDIGDLRKSIQHTTERKGSEIVSTVHTNSDHALYVEFGTGPVGASNHAGAAPESDVSYSHEKWIGVIPELKSDTDAGIRYIAGQAAQPYLYPALKENEEQIMKKLDGSIEKMLEDIFDG